MDNCAVIQVTRHLLDDARLRIGQATEERTSLHRDMISSCNGRSAW